MERRDGKRASRKPLQILFTFESAGVDPAGGDVVAGTAAAPSVCGSVSRYIVFETSSSLLP